MATAPVKSPLHNFPLPFLKWGSGKNHTNNNHRCRRPVSAESSPVGGDHHCEHDADSRNESETEAGRPSRTARNRLAFSSCSAAEKSQKQESNESEEVRDDVKPGGEAEAEEDAVQKPWNLRPRKGATLKSSIGARVGELQEPEGQLQQQQQGEVGQPKSLRLRGMADSQGGAERKEKRKFWIALSREEIEEDVFAMTGSRPSRRPKKRPKNVQKQLDVCSSLSCSSFYHFFIVLGHWLCLISGNVLLLILGFSQSVFPGLWLVGVTADAYRVTDTPKVNLSHYLPLFSLFLCLSKY